MEAQACRFLQYIFRGLDKVTDVGYSYQCWKVLIVRPQPDTGYTAYEAIAMLQPYHRVIYSGLLGSASWIVCFNHQLGEDSGDYEEKENQDDDSCFQFDPQMTSHVGQESG